jgi:hypothetical protein
MLIAPLALSVALSVALSGHDALCHDARDPGRFAARPAPVWHYSPWDVLRARDEVLSGVDHLRDDAPAAEGED